MCVLFFCCWVTAVKVAVILTSISSVSKTAASVNVNVLLPPDNTPPKSSTSSTSPALTAEEVPLAITLTVYFVLATALNVSFVPQVIDIALLFERVWNCFINVYEVCDSPLLSSVNIALAYFLTVFLSKIFLLVSLIFVLVLTAGTKVTGFEIKIIEPPADGVETPEFTGYVAVSLPVLVIVALPLKPFSACPWNTTVLVELPPPLITVPEDAVKAAVEVNVAVELALDVLVVNATEPPSTQ